MTDNTVPPIPPVPGASASEPPAPQAAAGGEYVQPGDTPPTNPYAAPAGYGTQPPAFEQNPYAQQQPQQPTGYGQQPYAQQQPYSQQPYGQPAPYGAYTAAPPKGLSIASLICGIGAVVTIAIVTPLGFLAGLAAVILGFIAKKNQPYAKGFWLTGIITGLVTVGLSVIGLIGLIIWFVIYGATYNSGY